VFEIMRGLYSALLDTELRARLKQRSIQQSARFSWDSSVRILLESYSAAARGVQPVRTDPVTQAG